MDPAVQTSAQQEARTLSQVHLLLPVSRLPVSPCRFARSIRLGSQDLRPVLVLVPGSYATLLGLERKKHFLFQKADLELRIKQKTRKTRSRTHSQF